MRGMCVGSPALEALNNTYERAMVSMHKMPRIWLEYLQLLMDQKLVTQTRRWGPGSLSQGGQSQRGLMGEAQQQSTGAASVRGQCSEVVAAFSDGSGNRQHEVVV